MGRLEESERATALWLRTVRGAWRSSAQHSGHNVLPIRCDLLAQRPRVDPCTREGLCCNLPPLEPQQLLREAGDFLVFSSACCQLGSGTMDSSRGSTPCLSSGRFWPNIPYRNAGS